MEGFDPNTSFGHGVSLRYDDEDTRGDEDETVAFLARLAGGREALEQHMVDRLREKPGGVEVDVTIGDMSQVSTGRTYGLVYLGLPVRRRQGSRRRQRRPRRVPL